MTGSLLLVNALIPQDPQALELLEAYRTKLPKDTTVIGHTFVPLIGANECKIGECNFGNLLTDSLVYARIKEMSKKKTFKFYSDTSIALINAGGVRASIEKKSSGEIFRSDIDLVLPFQGKYVIIGVSGQVIRTVLEKSASEYGMHDAASGILHMAGVKVHYNMNKTVLKEKVGLVEVSSANCMIPEYEPLDLEKKYNLIIPYYLYLGGGGYDFKEEGAKNVSSPLHVFPETDVEYLLDYLKDHAYIYPGLEGRITLTTEESAGNSLKIFAKTFILLFVLCF